MPVHPMRPKGHRRTVSRMAETNRVALATKAAGSPTPAIPTVQRVPPSQWPPADSPVWDLVGAERAHVETYYASLDGFVTFPGLEAYLVARAGLEQWPTPRIITYCQSEDDVARALTWARERDWLISVRSGGHCDAGFQLCNGMVIDLSAMKKISFDKASKRVTAQAGVTFQDLSDALATAGGLFVPGGTCPTVCVAGYTMGGGYSLASRTYGMCCDRVQSVRLMRFCGTIVECSVHHEEELFWALRGGSGGQFGVLLEITYDAPVQPVFWGFVAQWPLDDAVKVLECLEQDHTWSVVNTSSPFGYLGALSHLVSEDDPTQVEDECSMVVLGMFAGTEKEGRAALAGLLGIGQVRIRLSLEADYSKVNTELFTLLPYGALDLAEASSMSSSGLVEPASDPDWNNLVEVARNMPNPGNLIAIEPYGGAIGARPDSFNAFPHRGMKLDIMVDSFWSGSWPYNKTRTTAQVWLDQALYVLAPSFAGRVYVNYAQADLVDYRSSYWAQHFGMLLTIKQEWDPQQVFRFDQSISWYPSAAARPTGVDARFLKGLQPSEEDPQDAG